MEEPELAPKGTTCVLILVEASTWVAYLEGWPQINSSGSSAHEAFKNLVDELLKQNAIRTQEDIPLSGVPPISRVKLVRLSLPC